MGAAWNLDFTGTTTKDADLSHAVMADGWYRFKITEVEDNLKTGAKMFELGIVYGPLVGRKIRQRLGNPQFLSEDARKFAIQLAQCWASRLGLVNESANGKIVPVEWEKAKGLTILGKVSTGKPDKNGKTWQAVDFDVYLPNHPAVQKPEILTAVGLQSAAPTGSGAAQSPNTQAQQQPAASQPQPNSALNLWD